MMDKCKWPDGIVIKPDGENELDPCVYEDVQVLRNVTVIISRCMYCGNEIVSWMRQDNTEDISEEYFGDELDK